MFSINFLKKTKQLSYRYKESRKEAVLFFKEEVQRLTKKNIRIPVQLYHL